MMPMPLITFETSKALTNKGKCQGSVCQYFRFNTGGAKFPNLINNAKYKTSTIDLAQKITDGTFRVTGNEIPSDSDMASMLEGYVKAPEDGEHIFWTRRSACSLDRQRLLLWFAVARFCLSLCLPLARTFASR